MRQFSTLLLGPHPNIGCENSFAVFVGYKDALISWRKEFSQSFYLT